MNINDCLNGLSCDTAAFADDVKIWRTIEGSSFVQRLQNDISQLSIWSLGALMSFKTDNFVVLRLHPQQAKKNNPQYQLNGKLDGQLTVYTDGSALAGIKDGGAEVIVTRGDPADPTILHQSHLRGPAFTSALAEEAAAMQLALA